MSEAINATALGAAGIGLPGMMWASDKLGYEVPHWLAVLVFIISLLCIVFSLVLWAHLLFQRIGLSWPFPSRQIPLHVAARQIYEAAEKAAVLDLTLSSSSPPEAKLNHFKILIMLETEIFGVKSPSTKSRRIPKSELRGELFPVDGDVSEIGHIASPGPDSTYINVTVRRRDVKRLIKKYLTEYVDEAKLLRAGKWPR
jgi:hypothetical protein